MFNKVFGLFKRKKKVDEVSAPIDSKCAANKKIKKEVKKTSKSRTLSSEFPKAKKPRVKRTSNKNYHGQTYLADSEFDDDMGDLLSVGATRYGGGMAKDSTEHTPPTVRPTVHTPASYATPNIVARRDTDNDCDGCKGCSNIGCGGSSYGDFDSGSSSDSGSDDTSD